MSVKKGRQEFFEVFRLSPADDKSEPEKIEYQRTTHNVNVSEKDESKRHTITPKSSRVTKYEPQNWKTKRESNPDVIISKKASDIVSDNIENLKGKLHSLRKEEVKLSQETIIIFAIAATFLSVACFLLDIRLAIIVVQHQV